MARAAERGGGVSTAQDIKKRLGVPGTGMARKGSLLEAARVATGLKYEWAHTGGKTKEYGSWIKMIARCYNPADRHYDRYGGSGIKICDEWLMSSFPRFLAYIGPAPTPQHSVDRYPNQSGNYEPENCRWATKKEQQRNMKSNTFFTYDGKTRTGAEWIEISGIKRHVFWSRVSDGWTIERIMTTPSLSGIKRPSDTTRFWGVQKLTNGRFRVKVDRKHILPGTLRDELNAATAYNFLAELVFGENPRHANLPITKGELRSCL